MSEESNSSLEPYSNEWVSLFAEEKLQLQKALAELACQIEHIGSTAIAGLAARPIIDIMVASGAKPVSAQYLEALSSLGYKEFPTNQIEVFCLRKDSPKAYQLYIVQERSKQEKQLLAFRDHLLNNDRAKMEYANLKQTMLTTFAHDPKAYEDSKTAFFYLVMCYVDAQK